MIERLRRVGAQSAVGNRVITAAVVAAYIATTTALIPDTELRASLHYTIVLTLGYGHLVGAYVAPRMRRSAPADERAVWSTRTGPTVRGLGVAAAAVRAVTPWIATLAAFAVFTGLLATHSVLVLALLGVATWHTAENDLALDEAYANGGRLGRLTRSADEQLAGLGETLVLLALAGGALTAGALQPDLTTESIHFAHGAWLLRGLTLLAGTVLVVRQRSDRHEAIGLGLIGASVLLDASLAGRLGLTFGDVFAASTGYHLVSWIVLTWHRSANEPRRTMRLLAATHVAPIALGTACLSLETPLTAALRQSFFAPAPYLFWSVAHVFHTLWKRERGKRA